MRRIPCNVEHGKGEPWVSMLTTAKPNGLKPDATLQGILLMKYLVSTQAARESVERLMEWRSAKDSSAKDSSDAIVKGQRRLNHDDLRKRLAGFGRILRDIDGDDTRSKIQLRLFYYKLWSTVEDLMANDKAIKGKAEKLAIATGKVRPGDVRLMLGNRQPGFLLFVGNLKKWRTRTRQMD